MSAAEIIAELPRLGPLELAQVQAAVGRLASPARPPTPTGRPAAPSGRMCSPRLARPEQAKDFVKRVVELAPDAAL